MSNQNISILFLPFFSGILTKNEEYRETVEEEVAKTGKFIKGKGKGKGSAAEQHYPSEQKVISKHANKSKTLYDAPKDKGPMKARSRRTKSVGPKADLAYGSSRDH